MLKLVVRLLPVVLLAGLLLPGASGCKSGPDAGSGQMEAPLTPESAAPTGDAPVGTAGDSGSTESRAPAVDSGAGLPGDAGTASGVAPQDARDSGEGR